MAKILVVEDNAAVRTYVITELQSLGYQTIIARNAAEALEAIDSGVAFDLLFTDIVMPGGMNGRQMADAVAHGSDPPRREAPECGLLEQCGGATEHRQPDQLQGEQPRDQREDDGGSLVFVSEPLTERVEILGAPKLTLSLKGKSVAKVLQMVANLTSMKLMEQNGSFVLEGN